MTARLIINSLGYLGLIPFAAGAWLSVSGDLLISIEPDFLFASYSAIILSFLGGVLWGRCLSLGESGLGSKLLLLSNAIALLAWFSLFAGDGYFNLALVSLMLGYVLVFAAETRLSRAPENATVRPYMRMRFMLTNLVLAAHLAVLLLA